MGKTLIKQARGRGSFTYRVRRNAYKFRIGYPHDNIQGKAKIVKLLNSAAHSAPLAKVLFNNSVFYIPACQGIFEGQEIEIGEKNIQDGNILHLKDLVFGTKIFNIEITFGDGGKMIRTSGGFATVLRQEGDRTVISFFNKKEKTIDGECRAVIGTIAGQGRKIKPILKAGKKWHMMKARNKLWPRTSAIKTNAVDHPFGGGRGKRIKSKIAKRNAPAGARVGHIRPRRTGVKK
jgi:large subunit ribosomal protein L2